MNSFLKRGLSRTAYFSVLAALVALLLAGCGGGGGGSSSGTTPTPTTPTPTPAASSVSVAGTLRDQSTGILLQARTVTVTASGKTYTGTTDGGGHFVISGVPITTITLTITDSNGVSQGPALTYDLSKLSGTTRLLTSNDSTNTYINLNVSQLPGLPPI